MKDHDRDPREEQLANLGIRVVAYSESEHGFELAIGRRMEHSNEPVRVSDEEIRLIRQGQAEAARGEGVDARRAFEVLRTGR